MEVTAGNTAILVERAMRTGSFASPPYDGFALISVLNEVDYGMPDGDCKADSVSVRRQFRCAASYAT